MGLLRLLILQVKSPHQYRIFPNLFSPSRQARRMFLTFKMLFAIWQGLWPGLLRSTH